MEFGIFNLMGSRTPEKPTAEVFAEVAEQTRLADELGYAIAWFAEHHFSNYCLCASPLMMVAHCASITKKIRLGTAVIVLPLYNPARLAAEIATANALSMTKNASDAYTSKSWDTRTCTTCSVTIPNPGSGSRRWRVNRALSASSTSTAGVCTPCASANAAIVRCTRSTNASCGPSATGVQIPLRRASPRAQERRRCGRGRAS